jgi:hypothetical protein
MLPMGLSQEGVELSRILFLENVAPEQGMEMVLSVLRSHLFQILIFDQALLPRSRQDAQIRKLQLTAEESGAVMLLLSEKPTFSFGVQIRVEADDGHGVRFQKVKGGME